MPGMSPTLTIAPAPPISEKDLHDKKRRGAEAALIDLGQCSPVFALRVLPDKQAVVMLDPMALCSALMLLLQYGACPDVNRERARVALADYMVVWRQSPWSKDAA